MAKKAYYQVTLGLSKITPLGLLVLGRNMVNSMTGNPSFATPAPPLADVTTACDDLEKAIETFENNGGRVDREKRDSAFDTLKALLTDLGGYVQAASNGDRDTIISAGCDVRKGSAPIGELPAPTKVVALVTAYPGRIDVRWAGVRGRRLYRIEFTTDPNGADSWKELAYTSKNRHSAEGLESNTVYYFRVEAVGTQGLSPASDMASAKAA